MPVPFNIPCAACGKRAPSAISPKFQPSPINGTRRPAAASAARCTASIAARGWWPIRSKRNESMR